MSTLGLLEGLFGKRRRNRRNRGGMGRKNSLQRLEKKLERTQARHPGDTLRIQRLQERINRKRARMGLPPITTDQAAAMTPAQVAAAEASPAVATAMVPVPAPSMAPTPSLAPAPLPPYPPGTTPPANWNEELYLSRYPDVAAAVKAGVIKSGLWHYMVSGKNENRTFSGLSDLMSNKLAVAGVLAAIGVGVYFCCIKK